MSSPRARPKTASRATSAAPREIELPWACVDYQNRSLDLVRQHAPEILEELHVLMRVVEPPSLGARIQKLAQKWRLDAPWIIATMHRTLRVWPRAPKMQAARQWAPVLSMNGYGDPRDRPRLVTQLRGMKPSPGNKVQDTAVLTWWVHYQVLEHSLTRVASEHRVDREAVRMALARLAHECAFPLRASRRGRPPKALG